MNSPPVSMVGWAIFRFPRISYRPERILKGKLW
jgi:hypothetical protein